MLVVRLTLHRHALFFVVCKTLEFQGRTGKDTVTVLLLHVTD